MGYHSITQIQKFTNKSPNQERGFLLALNDTKLETIKRQSRDF